MSVARLNLAHGSPESHAEIVSNVRAVSAKMRIPVAILADVPGPKYRVGKMPDGGARLRRGQAFQLVAEPRVGDATAASVEPAGLHRDVGTGDRVLIDDGLIEMEVTAVDGDAVSCIVKSTGLLRSGKGVATPGKAPSLPYLTPDTQEALRFIGEQDVDFVGLSCVRSPADIEDARSTLEAMGAKPGIVVKIERQVALDNLEDLVPAADAVMVARGDLGVDIPLARVPVAQMEIIRVCNEMGKPVITATQMMESMIKSPVPTRAEVTDIAMAIVQGTDAIMLSAETSVGKYPIRAVEMMAEVALEAEQVFPYEDFLQSVSARLGDVTGDAIAYSASRTAARLNAAVILAFTELGTTAVRVSKCKPRTPILALTPNERTLRRLSLNWGVTPLKSPPRTRLSDIFSEGQKAAAQTGLAQPRDLAVLVTGVPTGTTGHTNLMRVMRV
ncbi:MAG: pyruvate kinase [Chloroflexi bacterium]|jgi:pyruvate kinase|nr:MAG: pyruvate kinase [Chloroflexota bacterium]